MYLHRAQHEGGTRRLRITEDDWNVFLKHLTDTLDKFKVPKAEQDDLIKIAGPQKAEVVY